MILIFSAGRGGGRGAGFTNRCVESKCCIMLGVGQIRKRAACAGLRRHCLELAFFNYSSLWRRDPQSMVLRASFADHIDILPCPYTPKRNPCGDPCGHLFCVHASLRHSRSDCHADFLRLFWGLLVKAEHQQKSATLYLRGYRRSGIGTWVIRTTLFVHP